MVTCWLCYVFVSTHRGSPVLWTVHHPRGWGHDFHEGDLHPKCSVLGSIHSVKITTKAPRNRPGPKRKRSYSNHPFSGAFAVRFREGTSLPTLQSKMGPISNRIVTLYLPNLANFPLNHGFWGERVISDVPDMMSGCEAGSKPKLLLQFRVLTRFVDLNFFFEFKFSRGRKKKRLGKKKREKNAERKHQLRRPSP